MKFIPKNWKTTLAGIALVFSALSRIANNTGGVVAGVMDPVSQSELASGIGLLAARDHNNHAAEQPEAK